MPDKTLLDDVETYGFTCWEPGCEVESPERFTRAEAMADADAHRRDHEIRSTP